MGLAKRFGHVPSIHQAREPDVGEDDIDRLAVAQMRQCGLAGIGFEDRAASVPQIPDDPVAQQPFVLDHEDNERFRREAVVHSPRAAREKRKLLAEWLGGLADSDAA